MSILHINQKCISITSRKKMVTNEPETPATVVRRGSVKKVFLKIL